MDGQVRTALSVVLLLAVVAGCASDPVQSDEPVSVVFTGEFNGSESSGFEMDGYVATDHQTDNVSFEDAYVCLYDENRSLIDRESLGELNGTRRNVSVSTEVVPEYVVLESPDFWTGDVEAQAFERNDEGEYTAYRIETPEERFGGDGGNGTDYATCGEL